MITISSFHQSPLDTPAQLPVTQGVFYAPAQVVDNRPPHRAPGQQEARQQETKQAEPGADVGRIPASKGGADWPPKKPADKPH